MFEGSLDLVTSTKVTGWLYDRANGNTTDVVAYLHGTIIGTAPTCLYRPDLEAVGFGDGICGFELPFDAPVRTCDVPFVTVQPQGSNLSIPRTNDESYKDLVALTLRHHPGAGRSRTVFGGLWTDRTDALQILASRVNLGTCPTGASETLRRFIAEGLVSIKADPGRSQSEYVTGVKQTLQDLAITPEELQSYAAELASVLDSEALAELLRTTFDDVPIAFPLHDLTGGFNGFAQVSVFEPFTSPAEVVAVYVPVGKSAGGRIDYVRDSHEFPEFDLLGASRWTGQGIGSLTHIIAGSEQPIDSVDLRSGEIAVVGPGLIHRVSPIAERSILRIVFAPKRNSPVRFLKTEEAWREYALGQGMRARVTLKA